MVIRRHAALVAAPHSSAPSLVSLALVAGLVLAGCSINKVPRFKYGPDGEKIQYKRYEKHLAVDYVHHLTPIAFQRVYSLPIGPVISEKQQEILELKGTPDYVRADYLADSKEIVTDWVYFEKDILYQFVEGELVYEAPVSDLEKTLIRRGRPSDKDTISNQSGYRTDILTYSQPFGVSQLDQYEFKDGKMVGALLH